MILVGLRKVTPQMPRKYRLIPVSVEAIQITPESAQRAAVWAGGVIREEIDPNDSTKKFAAVNIPTLNGILRAGEGDYIVRDLQGQLSIMGKREFEAKYELID
jgi:hypothetical protein